MEKEHQVYVKLQKHLDGQAVGFPATRSQAEINILKHIFTPPEAEIATCLSYRPQPLETLLARTGHIVGSLEELARLLEGIQKKGGIETKIRNGKKYYCNAPLVVGMYELQLGRLSLEFIEKFNEYTKDKKFGIEFLSTRLPQMRTIPVAKSIRPQLNVSTFDEVTQLLQQAKAPFVIMECICRKKKALENKACKVTHRQETCLAMGDVGQTVLLSGNGRQIDRDNAMSIIRQNQQEGLVLQPSNTQTAEFVCSCCGCCCGMLELLQNLPRPLDFWASNFQAVVNPEACDECGICVTRCQVKAVSVSAEKQAAAVDPALCIGCGVCVTACNAAAISLAKKHIETKPPQTREDLYDLIMAEKKGRWAKLKLKAKLYFDAIRTGRTMLLYK